MLPEPLSAAAVVSYPRRLMNAEGRSVTVSSIENHGIVLVSYSDPDFAAGGHLRPGTSELVSLLPGVQSGQHWDDATQRLLNFYSTQKNIRISLDAVLFDVAPQSSRITAGALRSGEHG